MLTKVVEKKAASKNAGVGVCGEGAVAGSFPPQIWRRRPLFARVAGPALVRRRWGRDSGGHRHLATVSTERQRRQLQGRAEADQAERQAGSYSKASDADRALSPNTSQDVTHYLVQIGYIWSV
jgi:hypothetical protein